MRKGSKKHRLTFDIPGIYDNGGMLNSYNTQLEKNTQRNEGIGSTVGGLAIGALGTSMGIPPTISGPIGSAIGKQIGGLFKNGGNLTYYNAGGTHESNPNSGVVLGNTGNSVEEGEYRMDDRVLSKRLGYADQMKKWEKKSKLRPNDSLTKELIAQKFDKLYEHQEASKVQTELSQLADGGGIFGNTFLPADSTKMTLNKLAKPDALGIDPTKFDASKAYETVNPDGSIGRTIPQIKPIGNTPQFTGVAPAKPKGDTSYLQEGDKFFQMYNGQKMPITSTTYNFGISKQHAEGGDLKSPVPKQDSLYIVNKIQTDPLLSDKFNYEVVVDKKGKKDDALFRVNAKSGTKTPVNFNSMNALDRMAYKHKMDLDLQKKGLPTQWNIFAPEEQIVEQAYGGKLAPGGPITEQDFINQNPLDIDTTIYTNSNPNNPPLTSNLPQGVVSPIIPAFQGKYNKVDTTAKTTPKSNVPQNQFNPLGMAAQLASPLYQGALGMLNNDTVNFEAPQLKGTDPYYQARLQEQQINENLNASKNAFKTNSNSQGTYLAGMTNLGAIGADTAGQQIGQIYGQANQFNNSINNQNIAATSANNNLNQDTRQREKDASRTALNMALQGASQGIATGAKDAAMINSNNTYNNQMSNALGQMYSDFVQDENGKWVYKGAQTTPNTKKYGGSLYKRGGKLMNHC